MAEDATPREAYIRGRLEGLNELIGILKDAVNTDKPIEPNTIVKTIVLHISGEMDEIVSQMKDEHGESHPVLKKAKEESERMEKEANEIKPEQEAADVAPMVKKNVESADDLMKSLMAMREEEPK
ncbi:hypothetical protein COU36_01890 [Candidatus Micrarchaeota archaeon CG10_big_fil_rev_8_21_14_0_10_59_7]|nr:MAG: hypothetical protein COU36_01890 [Candidatus Micrarchaeota archaeon CG10_big_fil_rev_8_21_14_0_10_59_7]